MRRGGARAGDRPPDAIPAGGRRRTSTGARAGWAGDPTRCGPRPGRAVGRSTAWPRRRRATDRAVGCTRLRRDPQSPGSRRRARSRAGPRARDRHRVAGPGRAAGPRVRSSRARARARARPAAPAGRRVRVLLAVLLGPCRSPPLVGLVVLRPTGGGRPPAAGTALLQPVRGQVTAVEATDCSPGDGQGRCAALVVAHDRRAARGPRPGPARADRTQHAAVRRRRPRRARLVGRRPRRPRLLPGGRLPARRVARLARGAVRRRGAGARAGGAGWPPWPRSAVSFVVLLLFVLPAILAGRSPLGGRRRRRRRDHVRGAVPDARAVGPHVDRRARHAGVPRADRRAGRRVLRRLPADRARRPDHGARSASLGTGVDARGLLLAGMVIGALGVLDDVTVTQTSAVWELHARQPAARGARALFRAAMRIGRDHVSSAVNTLVLAYAGRRRCRCCWCSASRAGASATS